MPFQKSANVSFDDAYKRIFDESPQINPISGKFKCSYEEYVPSRSGSCMGDFKKELWSVNSPDAHNVSFCTTAGDNSCVKLDLKIVKSELYKRNKPTFYISDKKISVNEFKTNFYESVWQTVNKEHSHWCDLYIRHTLKCSWL